MEGLDESLSHTHVLSHTTTCIHYYTEHLLLSCIKYNEPFILPLNSFSAFSMTLIFCYSETSVSIYFLGQMHRI